MLEQFNALYLLLNTPQNSLYVLLGFLGIALLALILRILCCVGMQTQLTLFQLNAKEIKARGDIKETRSPFLNRVIRDYMRTGDKGVSPRSAKNVTDRHIGRLNFLGWSYDGIASFAMAVERNIVFLGIILTVVFEDYRYVFAVGTIAAFVVLRLFATVFDFTGVRTRLSLEVSEYIEREIGQFYAGDSGSLILRLKNELSAAVLKQSDALTDAIRKMGTDLAGVLKLSLQEMSKSVDSTMLRVSDFSGALSGPLENWKGAVNSAAAAQDKISGVFKSFENVASTFETSARGLTAELSGYTDILRAQAAQAREETARLAEIAAGLKDVSAPLFTVGDSIAVQLQYIERNQTALDHSLQRYELALEDVTRKLGDGLGSIVEFHMQSAYSSLNNGVEDNIRQIVAANNELVNRMQELFIQIYEQGRSESQAVLQIKEQMDLHFESLKRS